DDIDSSEALDLAHRLIELLAQDPRDAVVADAHLVRSAHEIATGKRTAACDILGSTGGRGTARLARLVAQRVLSEFAARPPRDQVRILTRRDVAGPFRRDLVTTILHGPARSARRQHAR